MNANDLIEDELYTFVKDTHDWSVRFEPGEIVRFLRYAAGDGAICQSHDESGYLEQIVHPNDLAQVVASEQ